MKRYLIVFLVFFIFSCNNDDPIGFSDDDAFSNLPDQKTSDTDNLANDKSQTDTGASDTDSIKTDSDNSENNDSDQTNDNFDEVSDDDADIDTQTGKCTDETKRCFENINIQLCIDGKWKAEETCKEDLICTNDLIRCQNECQNRISGLNNVGCIFHPVVLANYGNEGYDSGSTGHKFNGGMILFLSNPSTETANLILTDHYTSFDLADKATVPAGGSVTIELPETADTATEDRHVVDGSSIGYRSFTLESDQPVFAYQFNPNYKGNASSDASLLLPERALDTTYRVVTVPHGIKEALTNKYEHPAGFTVIATKDATEVKITPTAATSAIVIASDDDANLETIDKTALEKGVERTFTLNANEVLSLETASQQTCGAVKTSDPVHGTICIKDDDFLINTSCYVYGRKFCQPGGDLSGSLIESDKPIAVFSNAKSSMVPFYMFGTEHLEEQLPPVSSWGNKYVLGRVSQRYRYYACSRGNNYTNHESTCPFGSGITMYKIVAHEDNTEITIDTPVESYTIEEAPKDFNYHSQVDWVTNILDEHWNSKIGNLACTRVDKNGTTDDAGDFCRATLTLNAGEIFQFRDVFNHTIKGDKPFFAMTLLPSEEYVGIPYSDSPDASQELMMNKGGDPAMSYAVPVDQFRSSYQIYVPGDLKYGYIAITAVKGSTIFIDEGTVNEKTLSTQDGTWETAGYLKDSADNNLEHVVRYYEIHNMSNRDRPREIENSTSYDTLEGGGYHTITESLKKPFGIQIYGFDHYISYAYPGGLALEKLFLQQ